MRCTVAHSSLCDFVCNAVRRPGNKPHTVTATLDQPEKRDAMLNPIWYRSSESCKAVMINHAASQLTLSTDPTIEPWPDAEVVDYAWYMPGSDDRESHT